ncbi:MAG: FHA domain-containing protein [Peptococcaceae bacterium]|nr:FHA domain-containing protein [Peptococcaceae bacterium]
MISELVRKGLIKEAASTKHVAYVLQDSHLFSVTEYKVLMNQTEKGFLKCAKLKYNGNTKFIYMPGNHQSLESLLPTLDPDSLLKILSKLLRLFLEIKGNGFLKCQNIDIFPGKIFIDAKTYAPYVVYLPVTTGHDGSGGAAFENELRAGLIELISRTNFVTSASESIADINAALHNPANAIEHLYGMVRQYDAEAPDPTVFCADNENALSQPPLTLSSVEGAENVLFHIDKPQFLIGKNPDVVDGALPANAAVSRIHCKIMYNGSYSVTDMGSLNGTYVNGAKLPPHTPTAIGHGDVLKIANSCLNIAVHQ